MRRKIAVSRVRTLLLAFSFLTLLSLSPLMALRETPVLHATNAIQYPSVEQTLVLPNGIVRGSIPLVNANCYMGQDSGETICASTEEVRRDVLFYLLLLLYISFWTGYHRLCRYNNSPPPLIQQRALLRFLKRSDGRKRMSFACPQWCGEGVFAL